MSRSYRYGLVPELNRHYDTVVKSVLRAVPGSKDHQACALAALVAIHYHKGRERPIPHTGGI